MHLPPARTPEEDRIHELCVALLKKYLEGKITDEELNTEVAYLALSPEGGFNGLHIRPLPPKPVELLRYGGLSPTEQKKVKSDKINTLEFRHRRECEELNNENISNGLWLLQVKKWLPKGDTIRHKLVDERLQEFGHYQQSTEG